MGNKLINNNCILNFMKSSDIVKGMKWRLAVSIYGSIGTLIFIIWFLAFYPTGFDIWQNIAIIGISLLVLGAIMAGIWVPWGMSNSKDLEKWGKEMDKAFSDKPSRKRKK